MMKIRIYQINMDRDSDNRSFNDLDLLKKLFGTAEIDSSIYDMVYEKQVDTENLEQIFQMFNVDHPADYTGRSLSVSDVVEIVEADKARPGFYFCDHVGFKEVSFDAARTQTSDDKRTINVVLVEPGKKARIAQIDGTLEGMQKIVGGYIEAFYPYEEEVCIVCNEEGKIEGLPLNRAIRDEDGEIWEIIAGTFFVCDCSGEDFSSLSDEQLRRYAREFEHPERFVRVNGQILAVPIRDRGFER